MDLHHLAGNVATATGKGRIAEACRDVQRMIDGDEIPSPILAEGHAGASMASARGISIYFPFVLDRSAFSQELEFASATHYDPRPDPEAPREGARHRRQRAGDPAGSARRAPARATSGGSARTSHVSRPWPERGRQRAGVSGPVDRSLESHGPQVGARRGPGQC